MVLPSGMADAPANKTGQLSERPVSGWVMSANLAVARLVLGRHSHRDG